MPAYSWATCCPCAPRRHRGEKFKRNTLLEEEACLAATEVRVLVNVMISQCSSLRAIVQPRADVPEEEARLATTEVGFKA